MRRNELGTKMSTGMMAAERPDAVPAPKYSMMEYVALDLPFAEELRVFTAAGADGVGLSLFKPPRAARGPVAEMAEVVRSSGVQVTYCWPEAPSVLPIPGFAGPRDWRERVDAIVARTDDIAGLGSLGVACVTGPANGSATAEAWRIVVEGLRRVARAAGAAGLRVAIEPIHPEEGDVFSFISSISGASRLIADIGLDNVGIVADVWHLYRQADVIAELEQYADLVYLVHVCDRREPTRSTCDRVLPGDGVADVAGILGALERSGYNGFYELEVLSDDGTYGHDFADSLWRADPGDLVATGKKKFLDCYRRDLPGGAVRVTRDDLYFPVSDEWAERGRRSDAWAATREAILEVDSANNGYPQYVDRARGAYLWDVDGNRYIDLIMGYGPVVLGHACPDVTEAVVAQLAKGTCMSPMWHPRQVELTELLTEVIPGAEQAYLLRTGSDATTAAVRLARIYTGRNKVVRWGYNGWHDWAAPRPDGIPPSTLANTLHFEFNDPASLEAAFAEHPDQIACVIMMPYEYDAPAVSFFEQVKDTAHRNGALFILDEMRSGFRIALGGAQEYFGVRPDMSTFSKAMSNGYPISAVVGRSDVLAGLGRTHMSSTFYANPAEMAAAIATIGILRDTDALVRIRTLGEQFRDALDKLVAASGLPAQVVGLPVSPFLLFRDPFKDPRAARLKTIFFRETLRRGAMLHPNHQWFLSAAHTQEDVEQTISVCREALEVTLNEVDS